MAQQAEPIRKSSVHVELGTETRPVLVRWTTWREGFRGGYDSYLLLTADGPVLLDPEQPEAAAQDRLQQLAGRVPIATVLTNDMHERAAYRLRERWGIPVWAPKSGEADLEGKPDHLYTPADTLPGGLSVFDLEGRFSGDSALLWQAPGGPSGEQRERVLFTGDTLCGALTPDNPLNADHPRRAPGLYLGAGPFYLQLPHPERLKESLRPLLQEQFDLICGAHGVPVQDAMRAFQQLLELDWEPLLKAQRHPFVAA